MASTYSFRYSRKRGTDDRLSEDEGEVSEKKKIRKQGDHVADAADDDNTTQHTRRLSKSKLICSSLYRSVLDGWIKPNTLSTRKSLSARHK